MKNNQAKILAAAFYKSSQDKKGKDLDNIVSNFSRYLAQHQLVGMIPYILAELKNIHYQANGIVDTKISIKEELSKSEINKIVALVKSKTKKEVAFSQEIDADILGGAVVKYNDKIIDMSIRHQLKNLAKQLSN